jgi:hypothetical protein
MHATSRTLLALVSLVGSLIAFTAGCGGQPPTVCTACTYKTASFAVDSGALQGGTVIAATMATVVDHAACPYEPDSSACQATLTIDVKCKVPGAGVFTIQKRPNGFISRSSETNPKVHLVVRLPNNTEITVPIPVTLTASTNTSPESPCGGSTTPAVTH